jgi:nucleoside-diphosphate-sugar epimerase
MRVLVLGGTRFIGLALVEELLSAGHTVAIVHRGEHEPDLPPTVEHIHTARHDLLAKRDAIARFAPEAAVDLAAMTAADAEAALAALDPAVKLAAERGPGGVFNLAESASPTVGLWAREILAAAGASAELVRVPEDLLPPDMGLTGEIPQPWLVDSGRAARELGWVHADWRECTRHSVRWHLEHPPPAEETTSDFAADDAALAAADTIGD